MAGGELGQLDEAQFLQAAETNKIFGRVTPEQKAKLVKSWRENSHNVAMMGNGVHFSLPASLSLALVAFGVYVDKKQNV